MWDLFKTVDYPNGTAYVFKHKCNAYNIKTIFIVIDQSYDCRHIDKNQREKINYLISENLVSRLVFINF